MNNQQTYTNSLMRRVAAIALAAIALASVATVGPLTGGGSHDVRNQATVAVQTDGTPQTRWNGTGS